MDDISFVDQRLAVVWLQVASQFLLTLDFAVVELVEQAVLLTSWAGALILDI